MKNTPQHIVLFPDGNRRWAEKRGLESFLGHDQGRKNIIHFCEWCKNRGVKIITAFGFSSENWKRTEKEINYLMKLLEMGLSQSLEKFQDDGVKVIIIGQKEKLPPSLQKTIKKIEEATKNNKNLQLNLAVSYGGRWDIINAVKKIIQEKIPAESLTENAFESYLSTAGLPDPDLIIRVGGQMRLSNFVLWQGAYSELYFSPKLWPDFSEQDLDLALQEFNARTRRFGK